MVYYYYFTLRLQPLPYKISSTYGSIDNDQIHINYALTTLPLIHNNGNSNNITNYTQHKSIILIQIRYKCVCCKITSVTILS